MLRKGLLAVAVICAIGFVGVSQASAGPPCGHRYWGGPPVYPGYYHRAYRPYVRPYFAPPPRAFAPRASFYYGSGFRGPRGGLWIGF